MKQAARKICYTHHSLFTNRDSKSNYSWLITESAFCTLKLYTKGVLLLVRGKLANREKPNKFAMGLFSSYRVIVPVITQ